MRTKRLRILLIAAVIVLVGAVIGLIVTLSHKDKPGQEKGTALPEVPEGSVLVWLRTAEYSQENGGKTVCTARYTYDEYGRCVKKVKYGNDDEDDNDDKDDEVITVEYDETTYQTTETSLDGIKDFPDKRCKVYIADGQTISTCHWEYQGERYVKSFETVFEPDDDGIQECVVDISYRNGFVDSVEWWEYSESKKLRFRKKADLYTEVNLTDSEDLSTIREVARWYEVITSLEEFDEQGRTVGMYDINPDGSEVPTTYVEYPEDGVKTVHDCTRGICRTYYSDEQGRTLRVVYSYEDTGSVYMTREYEYGKPVSGGYRDIIQISDESGITINFTEFDESGRIAKNGRVTDDGDVVYQQTTRDAEGRVIRIEYPTYYQSMEYEYDEYGNRVKETIRNEEGVTVETTEYTPIVLEKDKVAYAELFYDPYRILMNSDGE